MYTKNRYILLYVTYTLIKLIFKTKYMATHSSILAWRILWREEPGWLLSIGSHRVRHNWSDLACMHALEKEMATHSSALAWRIPGTAEPGGLPSMGSHRVGHDWSDLAAAAHPFMHWPRGICVYLKLSHFSPVQLFAALWAVACQAPLSMGFSKQEYWSGLPCPPPGDLPDPGIEPASPAAPILAGGFFTQAGSLPSGKLASLCPSV